ncbi:hypothetical protein M3Y97_00807300 [Aphelenchoides bicaudatus]|nr:hypothetical protein M3Y97_00807300 [Aphelenchoides bicaudatus]
MADVYVSSANSSPSRHITVLDVYDLASSIKIDLDELVRSYGQRCVQDLACKVVSALETLEALAKNNDRVNSEVTELKTTIDRLESERSTRNKDKEHFEKEMVEFEETLKRENDDLWNMVKTLQGEKKQLQEKISTLVDQTAEEEQREVVREEEFQALLLLKSQNTAQKDQIKELKSNMRATEAESEDLKRHIERLFSQNYELVRKNKSLQKQCKSLIRERLDLVEKVEAMEENNNLQLKQTLQETSRACRDLENQNRRTDDSTSPRFSLNELREVLQEKTSLKQMVIQLREELDALKLDRPGSVSGASESTFDNSESTLPRATSSIMSNSAFESEPDKTNDESNKTNGEELVYGPINKEPDEKLFPWKYQRRASGIRKMFNIFFSAPSPR